MGHDGSMNLTTVEPYTGKHHVPENTSTNQLHGGSGGGARGGSKGGKSVRAAVKPGQKPYKQMTGKEKADLCCRDWNSAKGMLKLVDHELDIESVSLRLFQDGLQEQARLQQAQPEHERERGHVRLLEDGPQRSYSPLGHRRGAWGFFVFLKHMYMK